MSKQQYKGEWQMVRTAALTEVLKEAKEQRERLAQKLTDLTRLIEFIEERPP